MLLRHGRIVAVKVEAIWKRMEFAVSRVEELCKRWVHVPSFQ